jgi:hypothetical protein
MARMSLARLLPVASSVACWVVSADPCESRHHAPSLGYRFGVRIPAPGAAYNNRARTMCAKSTAHSNPFTFACWKMRPGLFRTQSGRRTSASCVRDWPSGSVNLCTGPPRKQAGGVSRARVN